MLIKLNLDPPDLYDNVHELVRMAFPGGEISRKDDVTAQIEIGLERTVQAGSVLMKGSILGGALNHRLKASYPLDGQQGEERRQLSRIARRFIYDLLSDALEKDLNVYGILTGMRPVKLVHRFLDQGLSKTEVLRRLEEEFRVKPEKARLLMEVASNNRPFLEIADPGEKSIAIYIGIPFCPSRCYYCSFPGAILRDYEKDVKPFFEALEKEISGIAPEISALGLKMNALYLGGGTPTVLSERDLASLFELLHKYYITPDTREITVEAGRPDTLDRSKLSLLKNLGVDRICINPQTMNEATLVAIGRNHDLKGVVESLEWAREAGIKTINMDLIVGLPGEGRQENLRTAEQVLRLKPDNITVHTLAVKKGSLLAQKEGLSRLGEREEEVNESIAVFAAMLREAGYQPYYMYRQKYIKASMENIGYSLPGKFSTYNIQVMEERQTLLGLGGGAGSKFFNWKDGSLTSFYNPKNPQSYCDSVGRLISAKVDKLRALN